MLWLYLLGLVTILTIFLRRVLRRQAPLNDELYSKRVAIEHVQSGVAWIRGDGTFGSVNPSFAKTLNSSPEEFAGREWYKMFPNEEQHRVREGYRQMLLGGTYCFDGPGQRADGTRVWLNVRLLAAHDRKMRFVGHYCLIEDKTHERELESRILSMTSGRPSPSDDFETLLKPSLLA